MKRTLFLTGGGGGIGTAIKKRFIQAGYQVVAPSHQTLDLADPHNVDQYFAQHAAHFAVIIHSAGYNHPTPLTKISLAAYQQTQNINLTSFLRIVQYNLPYFKKIKGGHILAISSLYSVIARENRLSYTIAKHGMVGAVQTLALELAPYQVCCNALAPGWVDTKMTRQNLTPQEIARIKKKLPLGRLQTPAEIARAAYFLCSEENTSITGQNIIIDGGFCAGGRFA